jgi:3-hydroxyisobutyrate dehydrogenase
VKIERFVLSRTFDDGFAISLMAKDIKNAQQVAESARLGAVLLAMTVRAWHAAAELPGDTNHTAVTLWLEKVIDCVLR